MELVIKMNTEDLWYRKVINCIADFDKRKQEFQHQKPVVQIQKVFRENYKFHRNHVGCENGTRRLHYIQINLRDDEKVEPMKATHKSKRVRMQY